MQNPWGRVCKGSRAGREYRSISRVRGFSNDPVTARKGEPEQVERLLDAVLEGAGSKASVILSNYNQTLINSMRELILDVKRKMPQGTQANTVTSTVPFSPRPRFQRSKASGDLKGSFTRSKAYEGWSKSLYEQAWFDSSTEREMANLLDGAEQIKVWIRLHPTDLPILWSGGEHQYNPDFLALDKSGDYWLIETKSNKDLPTTEVQEKRQAAKAWTNAASAGAGADSAADSGAGAGAGRWQYLLVAERDLDNAKDSWARIVKATGA